MLELELKHTHLQLLHVEQLLMGLNGLFCGLSFKADTLQLLCSFQLLAFYRLSLVGAGVKLLLDGSTLGLQSFFFRYQLLPCGLEIGQLRPFLNESVTLLLVRRFGECQSKVQLFVSRHLFFLAQGVASKLLF